MTTMVEGAIARPGLENRPPMNGPRRFLRMPTGMGLPFSLALALLVFFPFPSSAASISAERFSQEGNRGVFRYDLSGEAGKGQDVSLTVWVDGKEYRAKDLHLEGDVGKERELTVRDPDAVVAKGSDRADLRPDS